MTEQLKLHVDHVAQTLDDLADLGAVWARHRKDGRTPSGVRAGMIQAARELLMRVDMAAAEHEAMFEASRTIAQATPYEQWRNWPFPHPLNKGAGER